jgi:voltage-dependent calcium channel N type alpha-1B
VANAIFILEALFKIIRMGFVFDKGSYLRDGWCILDFLIVLSSIVDMSFTGIDLFFVKVSHTLIRSSGVSGP